MIHKQSKYHAEPTFHDTELPTQKPSTIIGSAGAPDPEGPDHHKPSKNNLPPKKERKIDKTKLKKAVTHATTKEKLAHFFKNPMHKFDTLLKKIGNPKNISTQKSLVKKVIKELMKLDTEFAESTKHQIEVCVESVTVTVRFFMHEGIIKIATMFIP